MIEENELFPDHTDSMKSALIRLTSIGYKQLKIAYSNMRSENRGQYPISFAEWATSRAFQKPHRE